MDIKKIDLRKVDYSRFVSIIKERNRPSGGINSVHYVAKNTFIDSSKKFLEIGSNTGFTCVNMSLLTGCLSTGIDINKESIKESQRYSKILGVSEKTNFVHADVSKGLPFENESFDIVWCSNVTSFIEDKESAIKEYLRVLKKSGFLILIPIFYEEIPPKEIVEKVSKAINSEIKVWDEYFWKNLFLEISKLQEMPIELINSKKFLYQNVEEDINSYCREIIEKNLKDLKDDTLKNSLFEKFKEFMYLFNENLKYTGFSINIFQKRNALDERELFKSYEK